MIWNAYAKEVESQRLELAGITREARAPIPIK
jgi:hypothetical protein